MRKSLSESSLSDDNDSAGELSETGDGAANTETIHEKPVNDKEVEEDIENKTVPEKEPVCQKDSAVFEESVTSEKCTTDVKKIDEVTSVDSTVIPDTQQKASNSELTTSESRQGLKLHRQEALASTGSHASLETSGSVDTVASTSPRTLQPAGQIGINKLI